MQGWSAIALPRELHVGVFAFVNPVWCLKPPLPSPLSGAVLQYHTELVIDCRSTQERTFWQRMTSQTAYELGKQMINLKCLIHRYPRTPDGAEGLPAGGNYFSPRWCRGTVIGLVEGHVQGRRAARVKEGPGTTMAEGSLKSLTFESVVIPHSGRHEMNQLNITNSEPFQVAVAPSHPINLPALTEVNGVTHPVRLIDGRGWTTPAVERVSAPHTPAEVLDIRPFVATTRSLAELWSASSMMPFHLAELLESVPVGQRGQPGPLVNLRVIPTIKLYGIESTDACRDGLQDLQKCLVHRGCSKAFDFLRIEVHRSDCLDLLLSNFATFKALASLIDTTCSPSAKVDCSIISPDGAIRMQGWSGIAMPRELHVGVFAFVNPVWCLKPPLPSPLSGAVLQHYTELVIDCSDTRQRTFWQQMTLQTAYELGKQMINLKCLIHRYPRTPAGAAGNFYIASRWCRGTVIGLVEGHTAGRRAAREKEGPGTTMADG
ncbi:unnamed protein product [Vitrella brassicaformis CCMP3155]|uniref:Uncharacterized protein n=1 Tax=Vitrella brassicaformis (strain CCMP3155) TaxID=1169540 RepID=A0A0G4EXV3_VITBC|nr:unnamed protein product [Vitrella brassicaformis CCMP3155]|eukprot:CEM03444.1 unnamed protein product [Vitrella brassicaformis CCMP3155]